METSQVISGMLKENTGSHFLDSGGAYGRNHEQNQGRDFAKEQKSYAEFSVFGDGLEILVTHNLYHWLSERLEFDEKMQKTFDKFADLPGNEDEGWLTIMEDFAKRLGGKGIYGDGEPMTINTYNGEDLLSQTILYTYFEIREDVYGPPSLTDEDDMGEVIVEGGCYVLLQVHGGCDVRGGYTAPKVFQVKEEGQMFDNARASIQCLECSNHYWYTDDGYHYYDNGSLECNKQLENYPSEEVEEEPESVEMHPDLFEEGKTPGVYEHSGTVLVYEKRAFCPFCGGELKAYMY